MKTPIILLMSLLLCRPVFAQTKFSVRVGPDFARQLDGLLSNFATPSQQLKYNSESRTGFQAGWSANVPMGKDFVFRQSFLYTVGGGKIPQINDLSGNSLEQGLDYSMHYIQLPIQFLYSPSLAFGKPWIGFGPYGGLLVGGKMTNSSGQSRSVTIGSESTDDFKRFDLGISPTAGITFGNGLLIGADFQLGLINISNANGQKSKNSIWSVYAGYSWEFH